MKLEELVRQQGAQRRKHPDDEEHRIQTACVRWYNLKYGHREAYRHRLFAVPNGGRRDARTAARLKEEGVVAGVADLILLLPNRYYGALLIEMKTPKGRQSDSQKEWQRLTTAAGQYKYVVCRSLDDFINEVTDYITDE